MAKAKIEIIYDDNDIFIINKPAGMSVTNDRTGASQLIDILAQQLPAEMVNHLQLVHRLDKQTSGVMILAKTPQAQSEYSGYFARRLVRKIYLAIVTGFPPADRGRIEARLTPDGRIPGQMRITDKKGKEALTEWKLLASFNSTHLLAVLPVTGRTHQIRLHLPSIGLPLAVDPLYGSSRPLLLSDFKQNYNLGKYQEEKPLLDRLSLHAYQLEFTGADDDSASWLQQSHPPDYFIAGLDKKFKACIKMLTKHNPLGKNAFINPDDFKKIINTERLDLSAIT
jgi:23S rRNA pseudouridine955/2504/2580 synthase/23S rRNA pseudouridine1911/1915/1917 synthase